FAGRPGRETAAALFLFAVLFTIFMTLGAKKFDRYLLPVFAPLDLVAGAGWVAAAQWVRARVFTIQLTADPAPLTTRGRRSAAGGLSIVVLGLALAVQALSALPTFPYYLSYFNPLLGGSRRAPEVMMIGWGEGLDQVARYLNARPGAREIPALVAWYGIGPFSYFFDGKLVTTNFEGPSIRKLVEWVNTDYAVLYVNQWQRQIRTPQVIDHLSRQTPEHTVYIDGLAYARVYNLRAAPPPEFLVVGRPRFTDWGAAIRLVSYELPEEAVMPGERFVATFYLENRAPIERDLNALVRVVGADGREIARHEGWPWGTPTSTWQLREVWPDGHELTIPSDALPGYYRVELSFYDPATFAALPAADARSGAPIGESLAVDYLAVGETAVGATGALSPPAQLGTEISLVGAEVTAEAQTANLPQVSEPVGGFEAGDTISVRLFWRAESAITHDYTVFVHVVGPDGQLVAQRDQQPLAGFFPTSYWWPGRVIADEYEVVLPGGAAAGNYELRAGMYNLTTGERLPVTIAGQPSADFAVIGTLRVGAGTKGSSPSRALGVRID
ncbi:MAG TPA: hypothetical protein VEQ85_04265, partial [Lacipirellulaceae bacterium]|nr:hypothetical protein [Lacipirellulaceae bacterium]